MGRKADACAETDFGFFDRCIGVTRRNHDTGINQFGDDLYRDHFWCQCDFGDHIRIIAQEINQRSVRLTDKSRIMGTFFTGSATGLQDEVPMPDSGVSPVFTHHANTLFHQVIAGGDKRWQIVGAARFFIGFLHDFQRFNGHGFCRIVKLYTAAAV